MRLAKNVWRSGEPFFHFRHASRNLLPGRKNVPPRQGLQAHKTSNLSTLAAHTQNLGKHERMRAGFVKSISSRFPRIELFPESKGKTM